MPYVQVPWVPGYQFEVPDSDATLLAQNGAQASAIPFAGVPMAGGQGGGGGVMVDPNIPLQQWALNYLLQTGQLGNAQAQTGINAFTAQANAANNAFANNTSLMGTILPAFQQMRGPANLAQYENLMAGQSSGGVPAFLQAAAGLTGDLSFNTVPQAQYQGATLENQGVGDWVKSLFGGAASPAAAPKAAGDAMTRAVNAAGDATQGAQAVGQGAAGAIQGPVAGHVRQPGSRAGAPALEGSGGYGQAGPTTAYSSAATGAHVPRFQNHPTIEDANGNQVPNPNYNPQGAAAAGYPYGGAPAAAPAINYRTAPLSAFPATYGRTATLAPDQMGSVAGMGRAGGGDKSDIKWKRKYHEAVAQATGGGHGSEARARANAAAGMSEAQAAHEIKRGRNPYSGLHAAEGMADVVTGPTAERLGGTTLHTGEGGKDELRIVLPLERPDQPIPAWALQLANSLSPDRDGMRGLGGVMHMAQGGVLHTDPGGVGVGPLPPGWKVDFAGNTVYDPELERVQRGEAAPVPPVVPAPPPYGVVGTPAEPLPLAPLPGAVHMAGGGVMRVIDAGATVNPANRSFGNAGGVQHYVNDAGQVNAPTAKAGKYALTPSYRNAPLAHPQAANASVMSRIWNTPSLRDSFNGVLGARGLVPEDFWSQLQQGLGMLGAAPRAARVGRAF